jgi:hypothetical protein
MGKGVVAMHKGDTPPARLPKAVTDNKVPVVPWNRGSWPRLYERRESENR